MAVEKTDRSKWTPSSEYERWARLGLQYTKMMLSKGPANQGVRPLEFIATALARTQYQFSNGVTGIAEQEMVYRGALSIKTGNCSEHAAVAFIYLHRLGIRPLAVFGYPGAGGGHMMCAVGLDLDSPNFTMGVDAERLRKDLSWVCDPWKNVCYPGREFAQRENRFDLQVQAVSV